MPQHHFGDSSPRLTAMFRRPGPAEVEHRIPSRRHIRYVDNGHYVVPPPNTTFEAALEFASEKAGRTAFLLYPKPAPADGEELARAWDLHPLLVEDLLQAGQRPKLERYDDTLFTVVRSAWYVDAKEDVDFAEFHILVRKDAVAVLCQDGRWIDGVDADDASESVERGEKSLLDEERFLEFGPEGVLYRILDVIVDGYLPVVRGLEIDKKQIERQVFSGDSAAAERIYRLSQEVIDLREAVSGLTEVLDSLCIGFGLYQIAPPLQAYIQDVADHLSRVETKVAELRDSLSQILTVNATLVAQRQNEDTKKISAWAAIFLAPTLIAAVYGMNFSHMPELHWTLGYPLAIGSMVAVALVLYAVFKRQKWL